MKDLPNLSVVIVTHVYATGPSFKLEEYLKDKVKSLIFIGHPFSFAADRRSFIRVYRKNKLIYEKKFIQWGGHDFIFYLKDFFLTLWWIFRVKGQIDYFIGVNNFNAFSGFVLKQFRKIKKVIFYTIDYIPNRFENKSMNSFYHFLDSFAVENSDRVWNLSEIMVKEREKKGLDIKYRRKQITVPIGTDIKIKPFPFNKIDRNKIVFMGHLREGQGLEMLISSMKDIVKKVPAAHLLIVGGGPLEKELKKLVLRLKLKKNVKFAGFVKDFYEMQSLLRDGAIAVAPYVDDIKTYTRYTDPGKPKDYLACGLPVVITKVPQVAFEIEKNKCGFAISYKKNELVKSVLKLLSDDELLIHFRKNAIDMSKKYDWNKIFYRAFSKTL